MQYYIVVQTNERLNGEYQLTCNNNQIVTGQYINGLKSGKWITKTAKGTTIKRAEYIDGKPNGRYELFHFNGTPKLVATFTNGQQDGLWQYFNEKGKIIKTGSYQTGRPIGAWTIFDKGGKESNCNLRLYNPKLPAFPFIVSTNPPGKLKRIDHNNHNIEVLRENIAETISIMGPWIGNSKVDIYMPFVLNDIRRF